jgi:hypothetical protein
MQNLYSLQPTKPCSSPTILVMAATGLTRDFLDGLPRSASVVALRDSELLFVSNEKFHECARKHPDVYLHLLTLLASRLRETNDIVAAESFLPLRGRVALTLIELAEHFGESVGADRIMIRQKFGQLDLAAMAGIARENVNRILAEWKRRKLIGRISGYYCIENMQALQSEAHRYSAAITSTFEPASCLCGDTWRGGRYFAAVFPACPTLRLFLRSALLPNCHQRPRRRSTRAAINSRRRITGSYNSKGSAGCAEAEPKK